MLDLKTLLDVKGVAEAGEERVLTGVKLGQAAMIDGLKSAVALADRVVPDAVAGRIENRVGSLPDASPVVDGVFSFAGRLLDAQREFVGQVVEIIQPTPVPAPVQKSTAKKSTAKKSAPKKPAAKKSTAKKTPAKKRTAKAA